MAEDVGYSSGTPTATMGTREVGGIWRLLPHEATRREYNEWEKQQIETNRAELKGAQANAYIERLAELKDSGMDSDQIDQTIRRERKQAQSM